MRRSITSCPPRPSRRAVALLAGAVLVLTGTLVSSGCVTRGTHREVVESRDTLEREGELLRNRVRLLEASNESLSNERVELISSVEDLSSEREALASSVDELRATRDALQENLAVTSSQLAKQETEVAQLRDTYDGLVEDLQSEVAAGRVQIEQYRDGLSVKLAQAVLFPSGSAELGGEGAAVLAKVAHRLTELPHRILVEGHTDAVPIRGGLAGRYPSNWELAGARAARVVRLLAQEGIPGDRLEAVALADTQPVASNETAEGRAANRRIEIRLEPATRSAAEPGPADAASGE